MSLHLIMPPLILLAVSMVGSISGGISDEMAPWPFSIAILAFGLPHGAIDLRLTAKLDGVPLATAASRFGWYLLFMSGATVGLWLHPAATLFGFALLSAWHFGRSDVDDHKILLAQEKRKLRVFASVSSGKCFRSLRMAAWARGLLILTLPFCFHAEQSAAAAEELVRLCGAQLSSNNSSLQNGSIFIASVCGTFELARIVTFQYLGCVQLARLILLEICSLVIAFGTLHPMFAMGLYFGVWHSWRHLRRLSLALYPNLSSSLNMVFRLHYESLPLLIPTLVIIFLLCNRMAETINVRNVASVSLLVYVVVTLPHDLLCGRLFKYLTRAREQKHALSCELAAKACSASST